MAVTALSSAVFTATQFDSNTAQQSGGALHSSASTVALATSAFVKNKALANGGAVSLDAQSTVASLGNVSFVANAAGGGGGAVFWQWTAGLSAPHVIAGAVFQQNAAVYGANWYVPGPASDLLCCGSNWRRQLACVPCCWRAGWCVAAAPSP